MNKKTIEKLHEYGITSYDIENWDKQCNYDGLAGFFLAMKNVAFTKFDTEAQRIFDNLYQWAVNMSVERGQNKMIMKLSNHPYAQCHVEIDGMKGIHFISYSTEIITISPAGWLTCYGLYSATTRKQIGYFMKEYCAPLTYYDAKRCYYDNVQINVHTGEIRDVETA